MLMEKCMGMHRIGQKLGGLTSKMVIVLWRPQYQSRTTLWFYKQFIYKKVKLRHAGNKPVLLVSPINM
jgi:hypothetical protein